MTNQEPISNQTFHMNKFTVTGVLPNGKEFTVITYANNAHEAKTVILHIEPCAIVYAVN